MDMFTNYNNIPASYVPCNLNAQPFCTEHYVKPLEEYNAKGELIGYSWHYGDTVVLEFCTSGEVIYDNYYEDAETYLKGKTFRLDLFDFRYENVYSDKLSAEITVKFHIDAQTSNKLFRGVYRCMLTLIDDKTNLEYTLIDKDSCVFMIE